MHYKQPSCSLLYLSIRGLVCVDCDGYFVAIFSSYVSNVEFEEVVMAQDLTSMSFGSATVPRNVDLIAIRVPILAVEVDACLAILRGCLVCELRLQICSLSVELYL